MPSTPTKEDGLHINMLLNSIFDQAGEGILVTGKGGRILLVNPTAEIQFGYSSQELQGREIEVLIPASARRKHRKHRDTYFSHPASRPMGTGRDLYGRRKDGSVFPVEVSLTPIVSGSQQLVIAFVIDITMRKQNEEIIFEKQRQLEQAARQLKSSNELLEKKVHDRTSVLREALHALEKSKADLSKALEMEKELNELKSRFLAMASHEFRTPLTAILSSAGLIADYPESEQQDKRMRHVDRIKLAVNNLTDILNDFLSLSRIEEGKITMDYSTFSFRKLMDDVCNELKAVAKPGQHLACIFEGDEQVMLDRKMVRQIMVNLLSNAMKYSGEDTEVAMHAVRRKNILEIEVRDQGIGISPQDQEHLFERFFRGENAANIQGTGLGLNIVANYVELLDGVITFESELKRGSVFKVRLPLKTKRSIR